MEQHPFHAGELAVQQRVGEEVTASRNSRAMSHTIMNGAWKFLENQPFVLLSSQDDTGQVWTSLIAGEPGFIKVLDQSNLVIDKTRVGSNPLDIAWLNIRNNPSIGLLFIELASRRRFRVNGKINPEGDKLLVNVEQCFPNCPKYIQSRQVTLRPTPVYSSTFHSGKELSPELMAWVSSADTFFVGSSNLQGDMDASHRGGPPGFVEVKNATTLQIPDYKGNSLYNTLGNFMVNPAAGLLFVDFARHLTLQLTGKAQIVWEQPEALSQTGGTGRLWQFHLREWRQLENGATLQWEFLTYSPFNPA